MPTNYRVSSQLPRSWQIASRSYRNNHLPANFITHGCVNDISSELGPRRYPMLGGPQHALSGLASPEALGNRARMLLPTMTPRLSR